MKKLGLALCALMIGIPCFAATDSLDIKIGQMIMIGIGDRKKVTDRDPLLEELKAGKIGGIVLFEKNIDSATAAASLKDMIGQCRAAASIPLWVSIDEEGGKVHRLKEKYGFVGMPSAAYLGQLNQPDSTRYYSARLATELKDLGFNMNYAPDVDVAVNPDNTVIVGKNRSYSAVPEVVSEQAMACIQVQAPLGITNILKHFPGHGSSAGDSHLGIVDVSSTWKFSELIPYAQILEAGQCHAVMTAHIINSRWDNSMLPATLSKGAIQGMLRGLLQFDGVVFSDDMQMGAISKNYGFAKSITLAINAGVDVLMFANNVGKDVQPVSATEVHALIRKLVRKHKISRKRIDEAYARICKLKGISA